MKKFEYNLLKLDSGAFGGLDYHKLNERLNHLGLQGWELVTTTSLTSFGATATLLLTFRRELPG